jgi:hypothetical protein
MPCSMTVISPGENSARRPMIDILTLLRNSTQNAF